MRSIMVHVFVTLGVIFLVLIIIGGYFFLVDPYDMRGSSVPVPSNSALDSSTQSAAQSTTQPSPSIEGEVTGGFELSSAQVEALVSLGIDPATIPSSVSAAQEECFIAALGESRVGEIKAGAVPGALEFLKAKSCI